MKSIEGAVITVENAAYLDSITSDYAGSRRDDYQFALTSPRDGGTAFIRPGFVVELVQRDVEELVVESFEVVGVEARSGLEGPSTITLDRAVSAAWSPRAHVDLRFASFLSDSAEQRKYAFVNSLETRTIAQTGAPAKNWGT